MGGQPQDLPTPVGSDEVPVETVLADLARHPVRGTLVWPGPGEVELRRSWLPFSQLASVDRWRDLAGRYAHLVGSDLLPVGGACALQHWSGDWLGVVLPVWLRTGGLLDLDLGRWWGRPDAGGGPAGLAVTGDVDGVVSATDPSPDEVAAAVVDACTPLVAAVSAATRITPKLAWGSVVTSAASILATVHRGLAPERRADFAALVARVVDAPAWPYPGLVVPLEIAAADGLRLAHERRTCCLVRLGGSPACASCRDLPAQERRNRMATAVRGLDPGPELSLRPSLLAASLLASTTCPPRRHDRPDDVTAPVSPRRAPATTPGRPAR